MRHEDEQQRPTSRMNISHPSAQATAPPPHGGNKEHHKVAVHSTSRFYLLLSDSGSCSSTSTIWTVSLPCCCCWWRISSLIAFHPAVSCVSFKAQKDHHKEEPCMRVGHYLTRWGLRTDYYNMASYSTLDTWYWWLSSSILILIVVDQHTTSQEDWGLRRVYHEHWCGTITFVLVSRLVIMCCCW